MDDQEQNAAGEGGGVSNFGWNFKSIVRLDRDSKLGPKKSLCSDRTPLSSLSTQGVAQVITPFEGDPKSFHRVDKSRQDQTYSVSVLYGCGE